MPRKGQNLHGEAGEHWVLYKLLRQDGVDDAVQASAGIRGHDLYAFLANGDRRRIQVKTRTTPGGDRGWWVGKEPEIAGDLLYALVDASVDGEPAAYIVPSWVIAKCVSEISAAKGRPLDRPKICPSFGTLGLPSFPDGWIERYRDRWDLVGPETGPLAFCMTDREKVHMQEPREITMESGKPAIVGVCPKCGSELSTLGSLSDWI